MIRLVSRELQSEIRLHRGADVRWTGGIDTPATVFVLMLNNPVRGFLEALGVARSEQRVQQNVIRLQGGVGFQFPAPIAIFMLGGEEKLAGGAHGGGYAAGQPVDLAKTKLRFRG